MTACHLAMLKNCQICHRYEPVNRPRQASLRRTYHPCAVTGRVELFFFDVPILRKLGPSLPNHWKQPLGEHGPSAFVRLGNRLMDRHYYWDHPKDGFRVESGVRNLPMLAHFEDGILPQIAAAKYGQTDGSYGVVLLLGERLHRGGSIDRRDACLPAGLGCHDLV